MALIRGIQIIGLFFGLFMAYYTFIIYKKRQLKSLEFGAWLCLWILFIIASMVPDLLKIVASSLQVYRTMDFLIIIGFFFMIILTFHNYIMAKKTAYKLEDVVRYVAMRRIGKKKKRKNK